MEAQQTGEFDRTRGHIVRSETQGGIPLKVVYRPDDVAEVDYERDLGDPGQFPYTRGIYPQMYRKQLWIKSFIVSYSQPEETNQAFKEYIAAGQTGLRLLADLPIQTGIDPDHPSSWNAMMCGGMSSYAIDSYEKALQDLPLEDVDYELAHSSISSALFCYSMLVGVMERRGLNIANLRGSNINDPFRANIVYGCPDFPTEVARRVCLDLIEFGIRNTPKWKPYAPNGVDPEQSGLLASQEVAEVLGVARAVYRDLIQERGISLDQVGATVFSMDAEADLFETVAKFRATRRMWARMAKEELGATSARAMSLRIGIRTSGLALQSQKPLNNAARVTLHVLACVLGGVNSVDASSIDEAIGLPSREARMFNLDTQHVITHEANVPLVADPLGGSYYVEWLTNKIEQDAYAELAEVERRGGMWECLDSGYLRERIDRSRARVQDEVSKGQRLIVGVNAFHGEEGPINRAIEQTSYRVPSRRARLKNIAAVRKLKRERDAAAAVAALRDLYLATRDGGNVVRPVIEAAKADVTIGEVVGTIRLAYGYNYDPLGQVATPRVAKEAVS
ncbi:MAG: methylmalonyl-CoA mutase family protein [Chloroflexota bacterium]